MKTKTKSALIIGLSLFSILLVMLMDPIRQNTHYHNFADQREILNIANFLNVVSNIGFIIVGIQGLWHLKSGQLKRPISLIYFVLFLGITLTGVGSAYYHLEPTNFTLVWDRLPMTLVFMAFLSAVICERISLKAGSLLFLPLLATGIASVWWWYYSELLGQGDLRAYALVQFLPMLLIPLIMIMFKTPDSSLHLLIGVIGFYIMAKICEHFDSEILNSLVFISGHSLKHVFASIATWFIIMMFKVRYQHLLYLKINI